MSERSGAPDTPRLDVIEHHGPIQLLERDWELLVDPHSLGSTFRSPAWLLPWWDVFGRDRDSVILIAHDGTHTVGLLPLYDRQSLSGRRLFLMGDGVVGSDYLGVIAPAAEQVRVAAAFSTYLVGKEALEFDGLELSDPLSRELLARTQVIGESRYLCPYIRAGGSFTGYLNGLSEGVGAQWRRRRRWLERQAGFRLVRYDEPADLDRHLGSLFALHRARWSADGGSQGIDSPQVESFLRRSGVRLAQQKRARLYLLEVEGAPRAALYGFREPTRFVFYQSGYDPAWQKRSVGTVLLGTIVEDVFREGLTEFDFLHGTEPYKLIWANGFRQTVRVRSRGAGLRHLIDDRGRQLLRNLRRYSKEAIPPTTRNWLRRTERRRRVKEAFR
jgi:CelD/BcsL family acetyltransferase involved in cellulose biosynthesis